MPNLGQAEVAAWLTEVRPGDEAAWPPAIRQLEETGPASEQLVALGMALDGLVPADLPQLCAARSIRHVNTLETGRPSRLKSAPGHARKRRRITL
jgi:hypothetical protein